MISKQEVEHIAQLARLGVSDKEIAKYRKDLSAILDYINLLKKADVSKVSARSFSDGLENVMREDKAGKPNKAGVSNLLEAMPRRQEGYTKVKAVLK